MEILEILGWISALFIGISLGLIGGGGSILTVPAMAYLFLLDAVSATAYSLFVVGSASLVGAFSYMQKKLVSYKTVLVFGLPAIASVYAVRKFLMPQLPDVVLNVGQFALSKSMFIMGIFAMLMLAASYAMINPQKQKEDQKEQAQVFNYPLILLEGIVVGALTGLVGAGGGFLIIPALVILSKLPMKMAVGTSLLIIAVKSLVGFTGDLSNPDLHIEWDFLFPFTGLTMLGILLGSYFSKFISGKKLKPVFGYVVVIMGVYILIKEFVL